MTNRSSAAVCVLAVSTIFSACDRANAPGLAVAPTPVPTSGTPPTPVGTRLIEFMDPVTGATTSDVYDAQEHLVQFNSANEMIWTADDAHIKGYSVAGPYYIAAEALCDCWLEIRFGATDGGRRAYLTADYGHFNPGTLIALALNNGSLAMTQSDAYPPGTDTLSGIISERTPAGVIPVEGADVYRAYGSGYQTAVTDKNGLYRIQGLYDRVDVLSAGKDGYQQFKETVAVHGDTRYDIQLVKR